MFFASWGSLETLLGGLFGRLGGVCGHVEAILGVLDRSGGDSEPPWGHLEAFLERSGAPERRAQAENHLWQTLPGVLFVRGPPGAGPRARSRNTVYQLPEILARLWPVGPAN